MQTPTIIKTIFVKPRQIFQQDVMEASLREVILLYAVIVVLSWIFFRSTLALDLGIRQLSQIEWLNAHIWVFRFLDVLMGMLFICVQAALVQWLIRRRKLEVSFKALIAISFWILIILTPLAWCLRHYKAVWTGWLLAGLSIYLQSYAVSCLTGLKQRFFIFLYSLFMIIKMIIIKALFVLGIFIIEMH